jgi:hypothetical protein
MNLDEFAAQVSRVRAQKRPRQGFELGVLFSAFNARCYGHTRAKGFKQRAFGFCLDEAEQKANPSKSCATAMYSLGLRHQLRRTSWNAPPVAFKLLSPSVMRSRFASSAPELPKQPLRENIYTLPNLLTLSRIAACPLLGYYIVQGRMVPAALLLAYAGATDIVLL